MITKRFRIHGDNIVECERILSLVIKGCSSNYSFNGPKGSATNPKFFLHNSNETLEFTFFPGLGHKRWNVDIRESLHQSEKTLRETVDSLVTILENGNEIPLIAVEYCSSLDAGNNAWQRCGRAYSFSQSNLPYFYLTDIGGFELDKSRKRKARRYPNPAVPFAYVCLSLRSTEPTLPVFERHPSTDKELDLFFTSVFNGGIFEKLLFATLQRQKTKVYEKALITKALEFSKLLATRSIKGSGSISFDASKAFSTISAGGTLAEFMKKGNSFPWKKTITIPISITAYEFLQVCSRFGRGLTKYTLPFCYIPATYIGSFKKDLLSIYPGLLDKFKGFLSETQELVICWIAGFKPRGDDSRPDRGLVPLARMLFGDQINILSIVYGPAKEYMFNLLDKEPEALIRSNGLWEAVLKLSDAVIIDSKKSPTHTAMGYTKEHFKQTERKAFNKKVFVNENPVKYGEQDIDTTLHLLVKYVLKDFMFEGMCNPPGGDWSGVSIINDSRNVEYRWLTLPRVSGPGTKRPDHVFQIFPTKQQSLLITVESKNKPNDVEQNIGPRLEAYLTNLLKTNPNVERNFPVGMWSSSKKTDFQITIPIITVVAFQSNSSEIILSTLKKSKADFAMGLSYSEDGLTCEILAISETEKGLIVIQFLKDKIKVNTEQYKIRII